MPGMAATIETDELADDYLHRATIRREAIAMHFRRGGWADVVCECQKVVELTLKALLRACGIDPPRSHDVSPALFDNKEALPADAQAHVQRLAAVFSPSAPGS